MKKHWHMPPCNAADVAEVDAEIDGMRGRAKTAVLDLREEISPRELCRVLHAMRRWYSYQTWNAAKKIIPHVRALEDLGAMDLRLPVGAFRGFKVDVDDPIAEREAGETFWLDVSRNGSCSSWTREDALANRFSGKSRGKVGVVVKLLGARRATTFIAPPSSSAAWFNDLYKRTMGAAFRFKEEEFAIYASEVRVRVERVKR